ncbi:MAG: minor capsid protein, partial [Clostridia bacterium]|nr:minor capsid protein [Clostridia bacterium]
MKMNKRNSEYWQKRYKLVEERLYKYAYDNREEIQKIFKGSLANINKEIAVWLQRFADNNRITYAEATRLIGTKELEELGWSVEEYIEKGIDNQYTRLWDKELENASARYHVSRLEALKIQLISICENMYGSVDDVISQTMKTVYTEGYYRSAYELSKGLNAGINVAKINENLLQKVISKPWADDGSNFSERIWGKYRPTLVNRLHKDLTDCVIRGENPQTLAAQYAKDFEASESAAANLLLTEYSQFAAQSNTDCLNSLGVEEFEVIETLDGKTCEKCQGMDKKHFPMSQCKIGVNAPPFHNRCRGTKCPYFNDEFTVDTKRAARDKDGKTVYVDDMSYSEWKEKFIKEEGQEEWDYYEKSVKNKTADSEQYEKYKAVLGKNVPKSLEEFQKMKYTDNESYSYIKLDYKRQNTLIENIELKLPNA